MVVNDEKLKCYEEFTKIYKQKYKGKVPVIHFFTITKYRKEVGATGKENMMCL